MLYAEILQMYLSSLAGCVYKKNDRGITLIMIICIYITRANGRELFHGFF